MTPKQYEILVELQRRGGAVDGLYEFALDLNTTAYRLRRYLEGLEAAGYVRVERPARYGRGRKTRIEAVAGGWV